MKSGGEQPVMDPTVLKDQSCLGPYQPLAPLRRMREGQTLELVFTDGDHPPFLAVQFTAHIRAVQ